MLPGVTQAAVEDVGRQLDGGGEQAMADPATADGGGPYDVLGRLVETIEAGEQQLVETGRDAAVGGHGGKLLGEERVAVGSLEHRTHQRVGRKRTEDAAQLLGEVGRAERPEAQVPDTVDAVELGEDTAHRMTTFQAVGAVRRHEQHPGDRRAAGEHGEQVARRTVRPMHVLDDEHDRSLGGDAAQRRRQRLGGSLRLAVTTAVAELGEYLVHRGVRRRALGDVEALTGDDDGTARRRPLAQLGDEARLADPGIPTHEHSGRRPGDRGFQGDDQLLQFVGPPDEPRTRHP